MSISKRDLKLLLILFGIIIFIICYFSVYLEYTEKSYRLLDDIDFYEADLAELRAYESMLPQYTAMINETRELILQAQSGYAAEIKSEDLIMYAVNLLSETGVTANSYSFIQPVEIMTVQTLTENENGSYTFQPRTAYKTGITMNVSMTYAQMKNLVEQVYSEGSRTSLNSLSLSYNSATGLLFGSVTINKIFLSGEEWEYEPMPIPDMRTGIPNPFGVVTPASPPSAARPTPASSEEDSGDNNETA